MLTSLRTTLVHVHTLATSLPSRSLFVTVGDRANSFPV